MSEIIHLQVGQCGNQIGSAFWDSILAEHRLDHRGEYQGKAPEVDLARSSVYFRELEAVGRESPRYRPRSICVDLEPGVLESLRSRGGFGGLLPPEAFINGINGASNNWATGYYTEGANLYGAVMEAIRKELEQCDRLQGFQLCHSLGGGTGSGMGSLLASKIREEYSNSIMSTFSVIPSIKVSDTVVEPYNSLLSAHYLVENADECFLLDNEALYDLSARSIVEPGKLPTYRDLNSIIARGMCGATASFRFAGQLNSDMRKLATNLIPFPRLHFFAVSYAPLSLRNAQNRNPTPSKLIRALFTNKNFMCAMNADDSQFFLTAAAAFRGQGLSSADVETSLKALQGQAGMAQFVPWIPDPVTFSMCSVPALDAPVSATGIVNSASMVDVFKRIDHHFSLMYRRKAFLHSYVNEGMDEIELVEAQSNLQDIIESYLQVSSAEYCQMDELFESDLEEPEEEEQLEQAAAPVEEN